MRRTLFTASKEVQPVGLSISKIPFIPLRIQAVRLAAKA
jgi:hypothetical protein